MSAADDEVSRARGAEGALPAAITAAIDRAARQRLEQIAEFMLHNAEVPAVRSLLNESLSGSAERVLADFGRFLELGQLGSLQRPAARACILYLQALRTRATAAEVYIAASALDLAYGDWPWVQEPQRQAGRPVQTRQARDA